MSIIKWSKFSEKTVKELAQVKEGKNLLILADTNTNMDIAATSLVAIISRRLNFEDKEIVVILSEGNIDLDKLAYILKEEIA